MGLSQKILDALEDMKFKEPSKIQRDAIPVILEGKDLIGLAKTGSGKTATCAIPICHKVDPERKEIQALIVVPTRELALQYAQETQKIGVNKGVKAFAIVGGEEYSLQLSKIKAGVQVLVATPGRLIDLIYSRSIDLTQVETLVLDEADEMLSMGFVDDLEFIIQCLNHPHQTLLFSATMPKEIKTIASKYLNHPVEIAPENQDTRPQQIEHRFLFCSHEDRQNKLLELIKKSQIEQAIVFCHSRIQAEKVTSFLKRHLDAIDLLHAGFPQEIRTIVTGKFRQRKIKVLVATDVVARGLDFSHVSHVFIFELSSDVDAYIHRSGRTGRFDKEGVVVSLVTGREVHTVEKIEKRLGHPLHWIEGTPPKQEKQPRRRFVPRRRP